MRLLHTSDWHLGRSLHRVPLLEAQAAFLAHLVEVVRSERVDAVLVAGDVFDRAVPPVEAVGLYDEALVRLREAGARVVVTSGNHDSAARLGVGARLVEVAGVHVRTRAQDVASPVLLGDGAAEVAVYGVPYLEPEAARGLPAAVAAVEEMEGMAVEETSPTGHGAVLARAMACVRADLAGRRQVRSVVLAHGWVTGGAASGSERELTVGGVDRAPVELFDGLDYAALGHLHGAQVLREGVRYCGSPLAYSFGEATQAKGCWLLELGAGGLGAVERVPAPVPRRLSSLRGRLADLLGDTALAGQEGDFLDVVLTDARRPDDPMVRLRARFPHVLQLGFAPEGAVVDSRSYAARVGRRSDLEVAEAFVRHVRGGGDEGAIDAPERAMLAAALQEGSTESASTESASTESASTGSASTESASTGRAA